MIQYPCPRHSGGWSLIEMLVVIALITILLGILINTASESRGPAELTKVTLKTAMAAATEYEIKTNIVVNHHDAPASGAGFTWSQARRFNVPGANGTAALNTNDSGADKGGTSERFAWAALSVDSSAKILRSVEKDALRDTKFTGGMYELYDGWGAAIRYCAFSNHTDAVTWDDDLPPYKAPYFASAGPDGKWGDVGPTGIANTDAADNLYSFNLGE